MTQYYLDTCIWLNLFKKEDKFWEIARDFIEIHAKEIVYSGFVLKELKYKIENFENIFTFLRNDFKFIKSLYEDLAYARNLESEFKFEISYFDCIHISICKRIGAVLITRDRKMIEIGKGIIEINKPEELF